MLKGCQSSIHTLSSSLLFMKGLTTLYVVVKYQGWWVTWTALKRAGKESCTKPHKRFQIPCKITTTLCAFSWVKALYHSKFPCGTFKIPNLFICVLACSMSTIFLSSAGLIPEACCMVKPLKFSIRTKPLIWVSSFSSNFSRITQYALRICDAQRLTFSNKFLRKPCSPL